MPNEIKSSSKMTRNIIIGLIILILAGAGAYYFSAGSLGGDFSHRMSGGESIETWDFQGAYTEKAELEQKARDEIARLEGLIGSEEDESTDYTIYVSIANQYDLLGDGKNEYKFLKKALAIDAEGTGLAWHNLGVLLARLGAMESARDAYARAAKAQNQMVGYQSAYFEYLTENFPEDTEAIEEVYKGIEEVLGESASFLEIRARWLENVNRTSDAIDAWKKLKGLSPGAAAVIDSEIARLEARN
jgi:tetratricopeptide (TPR) repeat protein